LHYCYNHGKKSAIELDLTICCKGANAITKNLMVQICDKPSDVGSQIVQDPKRTEQM
jgi:hypothetical protein